MTDSSALLSRVNPVVIGLLGRQGSGKSTVARYLRDTFGAQVVSFATPLKNATDAFLVNLGKLHEGVWLWDGKHQPGDVFVRYERKHLDDFAWKEATVVIPDPRESDPGATGIRLFTLRWLMRVVGTEMARDHLGPDVWVNAAYDSMEASERTIGEANPLGPKPVFVIDDVRFPNEVARIRSGLGIIIKLTCTDDLAPVGEMHASENVDAIPPELIDEAVSSHRSTGSDHLIGQFNAALERLFHGKTSEPVTSSNEDLRIAWVRQSLARVRT